MPKANQKPFIGAYLMLIKDEQILLQKRRGGLYDGKYSMIVGHAKEGEVFHIEYD